MKEDTCATYVCSKCGIMKPKSEFYDDSICMECKEKEINNDQASS